MTKIPIITQNFSSPDVFSDTPLMLLPQTPPSLLPDKDQEGFNQLLLHDLHRHRQSYVRSYTAFETLKKRHDFVLRQENLRALQNFEQRITTKQDQYVDQSFHSYEQCFVKVINGHTPEPPKRPRTAGPSFDRFHMHQLSHIPATPLDPPMLIPFHRYQKTHRPSLPSKYHSKTNIYRSAQSFHDAFQSPSFTNHTQPFLSFTESYLQKYGDRSVNKGPVITVTDGIIEDEQEQIRPASAAANLMMNQSKKQEQKSKTPDLQHIRTTISSRNTITPSSTPQLSYDDALRDGLVIMNDNDENHSNKISIVNETRRSSQQSTSQISNSDSRKRPKTAKKKQVVVDLPSGKKVESSKTKTTDNDILKNAMTVQNYGNNITDKNPPANLETPLLPIKTTNLQSKKTSSALRRSSVISTDGSTAAKQLLDNIATQMTTTRANEGREQLKEQPIIDNNKEQILAPVTNNISENRQPISEQVIQEKPALELVDNRKRVKKGAFDSSESMNDMVAFELGLMGSNQGAMKKTRFRLGKENNKTENETEQIPENQATLDLLEKIRQSTSGVSLGQVALSQQSCRFELPFDLKLLESLTPLEYLSKYCRLSSRRNYQFKRIFDKYRNNQYRFESNNLYSVIIEIHSENFTRSQFDYLCELINIGNEQRQFTFDTFAGILALCERILYDTTKYRSGFDDHDLTKETIEKCDFDSLDRKLDGLMIGETMKKLLKTI